VKQKWIPLLALVLAVCVGTSVMLSVRVDAASAPGIFHNDERWYRDSYAGLEIIGGVYYVPVDLFSMFSCMELSMDNRRGEFMLYNRNTGSYISVLYEEKIATVNGEEEIYLSLYRLHGGYFYVPAEYFCSVLSLEMETAVSSNSAYGVTLRISDGSQTQTMAELLADYDAVSSSVDSSDTQTSVPPVTVLPPVSSDSAPHPVERQEYLTFNTVGYDSFSDILEILQKEEVQAAFFFTEEEMLQYPERLLSVVIEGHTVGVTCTEAEDAADFLEKMNAANEVLFSLMKMRTRIVQYPGGTSSLRVADAEPVMQSGYVLWDWTYDVPDSVGYSASYVGTVCRREVERGEIHVLRMSCNQTVSEFLGDFLTYLLSSENHSVHRIHASMEEVCFVPLSKE